MRRKFGLSVVLAAVLCSGVAAADPVDPAAGDALFREGRRLMEAGDLEHACPKFAESWRVDPALGTLLNLAICEDKSNQIASAWQHFKQFAEQADKKDDRLPFAQGRASELERRLPHLTITLAPGTPADAVVTRDGVEMRRESLGIAIALNPGAHTVKVSARDHEDKSYSVTSEEGKAASLAVTVGPERAVTPPVTPPGSSSSASAQTGQYPRMLPPDRTAAWIVGGAGVAAIGVGTVFGLVALGKQSESDSGCTGTVCRSQAAVDAYDSAKTSAILSDVFLGAGVIALGVAGYLFFTAKPRIEAPHAARLTVSPSVAPGGGGLVVGGAW